ncbi:OsmC family protein [Chitinophaga sancti]|uniref:OsmC family protein n=1 Tax=Chitinophaga sancti TaxID=1004 RepID=A0A1K1SRL5_9BACT|nr:OsmC family protein [Chitinophaga sancti]WQD65304.1 OsmC family protein [Chitinophaga sancti]WQG89072.1 OsmC family protein [Chitinophaga sancti]SFW86963.1 osmotically inducible protein OsmC [Chitinophaga sancti]
MKRTANAHWNGNLKEGKGNISVQSTVLTNTQYSFNARFADGVGTNPEELLGASHAGCFTMALSAALTKAGFIANDLDTKATVELDPAAGAIAGITLDLVAAAIEGVSEEQFKEIAKGAKEGCPISKALAATPITLNVTYK